MVVDDLDVSWVDVVIRGLFKLLTPCCSRGLDHARAPCELPIGRTLHIRKDANPSSLSCDCLGLVLLLRHFLDRLRSEREVGGGVTRLPLLRSV